ncbi:Tetraspanin-1 [Bagarius yarrelli]|uniref:Tetraspanin-1 n=1 Tax=Bagarius yarrelli TaxID=175774 RepID=A0A556TY19_BAGYA|nr:Tetraspanin-1 [Bagarius yarrelli]
MRLSEDVPGSSVLGVFYVHSTNTIKVDLFFISVGIIMALLGFLGCCGAKKESKCLLIMFFSIIAIIIISELTIGMFALVYSTSLDKLLKSWASPVLQSQYGRDFYISNLWNTTMSKMRCCGLNNYTDFIGSYYSTHFGDIYHPSCCGNETLVCDTNNARNSTVQSGAMIMSLYLFCYLDKDDS